MKRQQFLISFFLLLLLAAFQPGAAQSLSAPIKASIDSVFRTWDTDKTPGAVIAVIQNGQVLYQQGYGMAIVRRTEKLTPNHVFWVASMAKQFTAMSIALLAEQGKLSLDDDIRKYLPQLPAFGDTVRIRHLVYHTSGLRDGFTLIGLTFKGEKHYTNKNVVAAMAKQKSLNFKPGTRYEYLNSGYVLLAEIVAQASGMPFPAFTEVYIFRPLGMTQTRFAGNLDNPIPSLATGYGVKYQKGKVTYRPQHFKGNTVGSSGLITTVADLGKWDANFYQNKLGKNSPELIKSVLTPGRFNNGKPGKYAFGLEIADYKGYLATSHSGADPGYMAEMVRFPEHRLTLICLANTENVYSLTPKLLHVGASIIQGKNSGGQTPAFTGTKTNTNALTGYYLNPANQADLRIITQEEGKLLAATSLNGYKFPLTETAPLQFQNQGLTEFQLQFVPATEGGEMQLYASFPREESYTLQKLQPAVLTPNQLKKYTGKYFAPEINKTYRLALKKGKLGLKLFGIIHIPFQALEGNRFLADLQGNNCLVFSTNASGNITGFTFNRAGISNLTFTRKN